jgi:hypothetical protein
VQDRAVKSVRSDRKLPGAAFGTDSQADPTRAIGVPSTRHGARSTRLPRVFRSAQGGDDLRGRGSWEADVRPRRSLVSVLVSVVRVRGRTSHRREHDPQILLTLSGRAKRPRCDLESVCDDLESVRTVRCTWHTAPMTRRRIGHTVPARSSKASTEATIAHRTTVRRRLTLLIGTVRSSWRSRYGSYC